MKRKLLSIVLCVSFLLVSLTACSKDSNKASDVDAKSENNEVSKEDSGELKNYGIDLKEIVVATSPGYEPFEFMQDEEVAGYDIDIWKEFEKRTGIKVKMEFTDFSGLLGLIQSGKADVVAAQMSPNPEREKSFAFTQPVSYVGSVVVVNEENSEIKSVNDLAGKKVGVGAGNSMKEKVEEIFPNNEVSFEIYTSATLENMLADVEFNRIDALLGQNVQAYMAIAKSGAKCKVLPSFDSSVGCLVVDKNNKKLLDGLNKFLDEIKADGTLSEISSKWIGEDISKESK